MSSENLPIDIVNHIMSFLRSDIVTLRTCAEIHPILFDLSERYIYANVTLCDNLYDLSSPTDLRTSEFTQILARRPDIANHVRSLEVVCVNGDPGSEQHEVTSSHLDDVASLLPMFAELTRFTITGILNDFYFSWHSMPETFCQAFLYCLHTQVIMEDIVISCIAFFSMSLLNNCKNVRVTFDYCPEVQFDKKSTISEDVSQSYPVPFDHISIIRSETSMENIAAWVKSHGLRSLGCEAIEFTTSFQRLLVACSGSLTDLCLDTKYCTFSVANFYHSKSEAHFICFSASEINSSYQISDESTIHNEKISLFPFTLANLRHLTRLTIDTNSRMCYSDASRTPLYSPIPAIAELLSTAPPTLKEVSIKFNFTFSGLAFEHDPVVIWFPFIPLAARCASASISVYISPSFCIRNSEEKFSPGFFTSFADYKGLTPYVQSGVVVISEAVFEDS